MTRILTPAIVLLALSTAFSPAEAGVMFFTDHASWLAAIGAPNGSENFDGFVADAEFRTTTVAANNMQISSGTGTNGDETNKIDVAPYEFSGFYVNPATPSPYLLGDLNNDSNPELEIGFDMGVTGWGADFVGIANDGRETYLEVFDGNGLLASYLLASDATNQQQQFYAFATTGGDVSTYIRFRADSFPNDVFGIDNIEFVIPDETPVPEPASLALLGLGLLGLGVARRKSN